MAPNENNVRYDRWLSIVISPAPIMEITHLPFREDETVDLNEMMRRELEAMANRIMDWQADELCGEGTAATATGSASSSRCSARSRCASRSCARAPTSPTS